MAIAFCRPTCAQRSMTSAWNKPCSATSPDMVLLWGIPSDPPMAAVERILKRDRVPHSYLDQRAILDTELTLSCGETIGGTLRVEGDELRLEDVKAVYPRPYDLELLKPIADAGLQSPEFQHANAIQQALSIWLDLT